MTDGTTTEERATSAFADGLAIGMSATPEEIAPRSLVRRVVVPNSGGVVALMFLPLLAIGLPWQAWAIAFGAWLVNRVGHIATMGAVHGMSQTLAVGAAGIGMMFRIWIIAAALLLVGADGQIGEMHIGLGHRDWAVVAMLIFLVLFTVDIAVRVFGELKRQSNTPVVVASTAVEETNA